MRGLLVLLLILLPQSDPGRIEVTVRDGLTDEPVPGVAVTATFRLPTEPTGNPTTTLYTDPRGKVVFSGLRTGNYSFRVSAEDLITARAPDVWIDPGDQKKVEVRVGRVLSVTGRILGQDAEPLSRASVFLIGLQPGVNMPQSTYRPAQSETDDRGDFRLSNVPPGEYYISIKPSTTADPGGNDGLPRVVYFPGVADVSEAAKLSVRSNLSLGSIVVRRQPVFKVSGTLALPPEARSLTKRDCCFYFYIGAQDLGVSDDYDIEKTEVLTATNVTGEFSFEIQGLIPGRYAIWAAVSNPNLSPSTFTANVPVRIDDRNVQGLHVILKRGVDVKGRVAVEGGTPGPTWSAVRIRWTPAGRVPMPAMMGGAAGTVALTSSGEFTLPNLQEDLRIKIEPSGNIEDSYVADVLQGGRSVHDQGWILASSSAGPVEVRIDTHGGRIETMVRDSSNQPVRDATVALIPDSNLRANLLLYKGGQTDTKGHVVFRGVAPGEYQVFAWRRSPPAGAVQDPRFMNTYFGLGTAVRVSSDANVQASIMVIP